MPSSDPRNDALALDSPDMPPGRWRRIVVVLLSLLLACALVVGGRTLIYARAAAVEGPLASPALSVSTLRVVRKEGFERRSLHVGIVEPARQTDLAFETGGTVLEVLVDEGQRIAKGDLIARLDTRTLQAQRVSQLASRTALSSDLELSELSLERQQSLRADGLTDVQSYDDARLSVRRATAMIEQADAVIETIEVSLDKATLRSPYDAQVGAQTVDEGSTVGPGETIASLYESSAPRVRIGLPVEVVQDLNADTEYVLTINGNEYPATLLSRRADVSVRTRTIDTVFQLDVDGLLRPVFGQTAELSLQQWVTLEGYSVPVAALTEGEAGLWSLLVFIPDEPGMNEGRVELIHIELLHTDAQQAFVQAELPDEAFVIQAGTHRVVAGQRVQLSQPAQ